MTMALRHLKSGDGHGRSAGLTAQTGGLLMIFVFAFILFFCCLGLYQLCKRCQCARLLGGGSRQRIEHSSDVPPSYNHRLVSNDLSHDDVMISGSIFRIAKRNDDSSNDKNGASSSDQSMT